MKPPVDYIFPPVTTGLVPYWRLVLRGCSQLCFQSNELTGLFFLAAVLVALADQRRLLPGRRHHGAGRHAC